MSILSTASKEDLENAVNVSKVIGKDFSLEDILCVMRNHESSNLDDIVLTFLTDFKIEDWKQKDKVFSELQQKSNIDGEKNEEEEEDVPPEVNARNSLFQSAYIEGDDDYEEFEEDTKETITNIFEDPITFETMVDAVQTKCGHSFSEHSIRDWVSTHSTCPTCNHPLTLEDIMPNYSMRQAIAAFSKYELHVVKKSSQSSLNSSDQSKEKNENERNNEAENKNGPEIDNKKQYNDDDENKKEKNAISLTDSALMVPLIREKLFALNLENDSEEKISSALNELSIYKREIGEHIDHHIVFNTDADEIGELMDTFDQIEELHNSILINLPKDKQDELRNSTQINIRRSDQQLEIDRFPISPELLEHEKKKEEEDQSDLEQKKKEDPLRFTTSISLEEHQRYLEGPFHVTREDLKTAKQILSIIEGKYTLDDVILIMRHHHSTKPIEIIELILGGVNMEEWRQRDKELLRTSAPLRDCPLCFDEFSITEMFTLDCSSFHRFCYECIQRMTEYSINDGSLPCCPHQEMKDGKQVPCGYVISEREVQQICGNGPLFDKYKKILLRIGLMSLKGCMGCPTPGCENWLVIDDEGDSKKRINCYCESCKKHFCSLCREEYHYHTTCDELRDYKVKWIQWGSQDRTFVNQQLNDLAIAKRKQDIASRMEEFLADEKWKEDNLRLCPTCKNPIERVSGCDSMICGQNYHGGDIQRGCGSSFNWQTAQRYKSNYNRDHLSVLADDLKVDKDDLERLKVDHGEFLQCDMCQKRIFGFRFACINCPCYNLCEECEPKMDHYPSHIFKIFIKPEEHTEEITVVIPPPPAPVHIEHNPYVNVAQQPPRPLYNTAPINLPVTLYTNTNWVPPPKTKKLDRVKRWIFGGRRS